MTEVAEGGDLLQSAEEVVHRLTRLLNAREKITAVNDDVALTPQVRLHRCDDGVNVSVFRDWQAVPHHPGPVVVEEGEQSSFLFGRSQLADTCQQRVAGELLSPGLELLQRC